MLNSGTLAGQDQLIGIVIFLRMSAFGGAFSAPIVQFSRLENCVPFVQQRLENSVRSLWERLFLIAG
jgi:hypothetical protein